MPILNLQVLATDYVSYINSSNPTVNTSGVALTIGERSDQSGQDKRAIIKFADLTNAAVIPAGKTITSAKLKVYPTADFSTNSRTFSVYRVKQNVSFSQATWNVFSTGNSWQTAGATGANDIDTTALGTVTMGAAETLNAFKEITLSAAEVQKIYNGTYQNYGFLLRVDTETSDGYQYASPDTDATKLLLVIEYEDNLVPANWSSKKLYVPQAKVSGSANHSNFPILLKDSAIPAAVYAAMQTGEINSNWIKTLANLKAYYRFESGALTTDSSGNSHTLTAIGSPTLGTGKYGGSVNLASASSQAYSHADNADFKPTGVFSVSVWVKTSTSGKMIVNACSQNSNVAGWFIDCGLNGVNKANFVIGKNTGTGGADYKVCSSTTSITDGNWHHIVAVWDGTNMKMYLDGILEATTAAFNAAYAATTYIRVGCDNQTGTNSSFFNGDIDDLGIINGTALTAGQVKALYQGGADLRFTTDSAGTTEVPFDIVSITPGSSLAEIHLKLPTLYYNQNTDFYIWYGKNDATPYEATDTYGSNNVWTDSLARWSGNNLLDSTSNARTLTNVNSVAFSSSSIGNAFDTSTSNSTKYVYIANNLGINGDNIDMMVYLKLSTEIASGVYTFMAQQNTTSDVLFTLSYEYNGGTRRLVFRRYRQGVAADEIYYTATLGTTNDHLIRLTYDGTNLRGYYDGSLVAGPTAFSGSGSGTTKEHVTLLANRGGSGTPTEHASALLTEARIGSTVRSTNWNATEYTMFNDPSTFILLSNTEQALFFAQI